MGSATLTVSINGKQGNGCGTSFYVLPTCPNNPSSSTFNNCPANQYGTLKWTCLSNGTLSITNNCLNCPSHSTSPYGSAKISSCICQTGYFLNGTICSQITTTATTTTAITTTLFFFFRLFVLIQR